MKQVLLGSLALLFIYGCAKEQHAGNITNEFIAIKTTAQFKINLTMGDGVKEGEAIQFQNQSTNGLTYNWEFGDGFTSTEINPAHIYSCGAVSVKLTVTGKSGDIVTAKQDLLIYCAGRGVH